MTTDDRTPAAGWTRLPAAEQAEQWEKVHQGSTERFIALIERDQRHEHRLDWADRCLQALGVFSGLTAVGILGWTATHFASAGAPTQGLGLFGAGAASIVGAFLTVRRARDGR